VTTATLGLPGGYARPFIGADAIMANVDALLKLFKGESAAGRTTARCAGCVLCSTRSSSKVGCWLLAAADES
jgi:hypothetical protein